MKWGKKFSLEVRADEPFYVASFRRYCGLTGSLPSYRDLLGLLDHQELM